MTFVPNFQCMMKNAVLVEDLQKFFDAHVRFCRHLESEITENVLFVETYLRNSNLQPFFDGWWSGFKLHLIFVKKVSTFRNRKI